MPVSDDIKKQHKKVEKMSKKGKFEYFWEYYRIPTIVAIIAVVFVVMLIHDVTSQLPYGFYATMVNSSSATENVEETIENEFADYAGIDQKSYECYIDTTTTLDLNGGSQYDMANQSKLVAVISTKDLDVMVADPSVFAQYSGNDAFTDLRTVLSDEQLEEYKDNLYYIDYAVVSAEQTSEEIAADEEASQEASESATDEYGETTSSSSIIAPSDFVKPDPSTMEDPIPVGIILTDSPKLSEMQMYLGTVPIFGIPANTTRIDTALQYLSYLES